MKAIEILKEISENGSVNLRNLQEIPQAIAELTAYEAKIEELEKSRLRWVKLSDEFNDELKTKDQRIAELEAMAQKMKCCMNCDGQGDREDNYYCFLADCDDNLSLWRLKDKK